MRWSTLALVVCFALPLLPRNHNHPELTPPAGCDPARAVEQNSRRQEKLSGRDGRCALTQERFRLARMPPP